MCVCVCACVRASHPFADESLHHLEQVNSVTVKKYCDHFFVFLGKRGLIAGLFIPCGCLFFFSFFFFFFFCFVF